MNNIKVKRKTKVGMKGHLKLTLHDEATGEITIYEYDNLLTTNSHQIVADALANSVPTNAPCINYITLGTNAAAPAVGDTQLGTENARVVTSSHIAASGVAYLSGFFPAGTGTATIREAGLHANGTASVNSGILFSHVALNVVKGATSSLTIDWTITVTG